MSKKILLICDIDSVYVKRYTEHVLLPGGWEIVLFPIWDQSGKFDSWFESHGVTIYRDTHRLPVLRHIPRLRIKARVWANARSLARLGPFDAIHNHYLSPRDLMLGLSIKRRYPNAPWVCSFWGSDLLRAAPAVLRKMEPLLLACDRITVIAEPNLERVREEYGDRCAQITTVCMFGVDVYDAIDRVRQTSSRMDCKVHFNLPPNQPLVSLGYNASSPHRHLELLQALGTLPQDVLKGWSIVLQMTYGNSDESYFTAVRETAAQLPCKSLILTEFMDNEESAYLRLAADAFVLAMPTDAFSSSLQEYLYAGAKVLCGDWLNYPQLDAMGFPPVRFQSISAFPALLQTELQTPVPQTEMQLRQHALRSRYAWSAVIKKWTALYDTSPPLL